MYRCPNCHGDNLIVIECTVTGKMPLTEDGFEVEGSTSDENIECLHCGLEADIKKFIKEE